MRRLPAAMVFPLAALFLAVATAGEKTSLSLPGSPRNYTVPPMVVGGAALAVASETPDKITYRQPPKWGSTVCVLDVGGGSMIRDMSRTVRDYREFRLLQTALACSFGMLAGGGTGSAPFEKVEVVREDGTATILSTRWRERGLTLYGIQALVLAGDLPLRFMVLLRDRGDAGRERDLERGLAAWADRVAQNNPAPPQRLVVDRRFVPVEVPAPSGYERLVVKSDGDEGRFFARSAPLCPPGDGAIPHFATVPFDSLERLVVDVAAFRRLPEDIETGKIQGLGTLTILEKGNKHCLVRAEKDGEPDSYMDFLFLKSRLLVLSHIPGSDRGTRPETALGNWRRDVFRINGELPD